MADDYRDDNEIGSAIATSEDISVSRRGIDGDKDNLIECSEGNLFKRRNILSDPEAGIVNHQGNDYRQNDVIDSEGNSYDLNTVILIVQKNYSFVLTSNIYYNLLQAAPQMMEPVLSNGPNQQWEHWLEYFHPWLSLCSVPFYFFE